MARKPPLEERKKGISEEEITEFATNDLLEFHTKLSRYSLDKRNADLDLALDKIARAITAIEKWHRAGGK